MSAAEREKWDARYRDGAYEDRTHPTALLAEWLPRLPRGRALDVACGAGRNALYLAANGYAVTALDISRVALDRAEAAAAERGLAVEWLCADLDEDPERALPAGDFDLIVWVRYVHSTLMPHLMARLAVGGAIALRAALRDRRAGRGAEKRGVSAPARRAAPLGARPSCCTRVRRARRRSRRPLGCARRNSSAARRRNCVARHTNFAPASVRCRAMRSISLLLRCGTIGALLATAQVAAQEPNANPSAGPTRAQLEQAGATIRAIHVTVDNVFDPNNPAEDKALYRWANKVHVLTRETVVEDILLFSRGRAIRRSACSTSRRARCARAASSPRPPSSRGSYDAATNSVDVNVHIRDSWSLALDLKLNRSGGQTEWGIGLSDGNLFGTGKTLEIGYESEIDRDEALLGYSDGNVFGSRVQLSARVRERQRRPSAPARASSGRSSRSTRAGRSAARCTTRSASTRCTTSARRSTSSATTSRRSACRAAGRAASSSGARNAGCSASRRRSTRSARRPTSRSRCCCRPTASSSIRGSAGNGSRTTIAR